MSFDRCSPSRTTACATSCEVSREISDSMNVCSHIIASGPRQDISWQPRGPPLPNRVSPGSALVKSLAESESYVSSPLAGELLPRLPVSVPSITARIPRVEAPLLLHKQMIESLP